MRSARLTPVEIEDGLIGSETSLPDDDEPPPQNQAADALTGLLFVSLKALSQRAIVALGNLFMAGTALSAWWLFYVTMPDPTPQKLIGLALYGMFLLVLNWMFLRRR